MDQSFFMRAKRLLEQSNARLDHRSFLNDVAQRQAATPTAEAAVESGGPSPVAEDSDTLCALVLGEEGWPGAAQNRGFCFNRAAAARRVNGP